MSGQHLSTHRRAGCAFDDERVETYAQSRSGGNTIHVAAQAAQIDFKSAKKLELSQDVRVRVRELRAPTRTSRSGAWFLEEYAQIAEECRYRAKREEDGKKSAALYEAAKHALDGGTKLLAELEGLLSGASPAQLPAAPRELRDELRRRLSSPKAAPIMAEGHETARETVPAGEALQ
jgi:hypothetical protein